MKVRPCPATWPNWIGLCPNILSAEHVHAVVGAAGVEHVGDEQRVVERRDLDAAHLEDVPVELHVVGDLEDARILEQRLQARQHRVRVELAFDLGGAAEEIALALADVQQRHVDGIARTDAERQADEIGVIGLSPEVSVSMATYPASVAASITMSSASSDVMVMYRVRSKGISRNAFAREIASCPGPGLDRRDRRLLAVAGVLRRALERLGVAGDLAALAVAPAGLPANPGSRLGSRPRRPRSSRRRVSSAS